MEQKEWWKVKSIQYVFNLPRVNAQLEKLMGSNVVHLTDRKYMTELRRRITEDFENMLMKRIHHRKQEEIERQMKLVLHGLYNSRNVPRNLISAHSVVLAEEIQRQRVLLMEGKLPKCPKELRNHPVLIMNESTNNFVIKRRAKLKTERERVSERMVRLGKKWEAEHILWEEKERQNEVEMKIREMELLKADQSYVEKLESAESRKVLEKCFRKNEMNMTDFLAKERILMLNRLKPKEKKFVPFTKDLRVVDAKRRMSEASISKLKSIVAKVRTSETGGTLESEPEQSDDTPRGKDEVGQADSDTASQASTKSKKAKGKGLFSFFKSKSSKDKKAIAPTISQEESPEKTKSATSDDDIENLPVKDVYVDPVIDRLKKAKNVKELYNVAEKIVGVNIENILDKSKSGEAEEPAA
ncbi:uncharacterized protein LOC129570229 isoform X2 [Sitodiplosis mosellana]|uniref:uncharacterized protein LOC129570229 isoform X2 n=1 Tax=Sitodiplosis mosellana TaxID=263140 RepID=UPI00244403EC|nr:uncharacterized protein LOC129570229 isoform X2 [Sitodiplosis mosellana]